MAYSIKYCKQNLKHIQKVHLFKKSDGSEQSDLEMVDVEIDKPTQSDVVTDDKTTLAAVNVEDKVWHAFYLYLIV